MISRNEENRISVLSLLLSFLITGMLVVLLIFWVIHVSNPPEITGGGSPGNSMDEGVSVTLGSDAQGYGDYQFPEPVNAEPVTGQPASDNSVLISSTDGVNINEEVKQNPPSPTNSQNNTPKTNTNNNTSQQQQTNTHTSWQNALQNANSNGNSGNNPGTQGIEGDPTGNGPNFGSTGGGNTGSTGNTGGTGTGTGKGGSSFGIGRKNLVNPCTPNATKREGKVVVIIKVDRNGNVIDADPNGPGTDTSDPELKLQARQAALCAKFEACTDDCPEISKGTIIFNFRLPGK
jgi:outer membrane biosynthesis protein TonB